MKKCRIYTTYNNSGYVNEGFPGDYSRRFTDAFYFDDGYVFYPISEPVFKPQDFIWSKPPEPATPKKIIDGLKLYAPVIGENTLRMRDNNRLLLPFEVDGKWGYCYAYTGKVIIEPKWDFCDEFTYEDYARFNIGGVFDPMGETEGGNMWGYIDTSGNEVIPPIYQYLSRMEYSGILAKKDGLWGVIDSDGDSVVALEWDAIWFDCNNETGIDYGFIAMKENAGRKQYTSFDGNGKMKVEDMPDFIPPEFPKQYVFDEEPSDEPEDDLEGDD